MSDPTTATVVSALSSPLPGDRRSLSRRAFLQAAAVTAGAAMVPGWLADVAGAAAPIGPGDGVLVLVTMDGGNDGLNTVVPVSQGAYHDRRGALAIGATAGIPLSEGRVLHPNLGRLAERWRTGDVAIIEGIGFPVVDLSHFSSMAKSASATLGVNPTTGWLGRYVDGLPGGDDPFHSVAIGRSIPLVVQGQHRQAAGLPIESSWIFPVHGADDIQLRHHAALSAFGAGPTGLGELGDVLAANGRQAVEMAGTVQPLYAAETVEGKLASQLQLAARLINADLGIRVVTVSYGDFDTHANQAEMHDARMAELDDGVAAFYATLDEAFSARTVILAVSEFGRRLQANGSGGTDHGAAGLALAIGQQVKGGYYGALPSLTTLDAQGNLVPTVDYRSVYATVLETWLDGDATSILGGSHENLGFLARPAPSRTTGTTNPVVIDSLFRHRAQVARLYLAYFGRLPDIAGYDHWVAARSAGTSLEDISDAFAGSAEFQAIYGTLSNHDFVTLLYRNVLGREPDGDGLAYWRNALDGGLTRGRMMVALSEAPEFVASVADQVARVDTGGPIARLYRAYFERGADDDGLRHWIGTRMSYQAVSDAFASSTEFQHRYGNLDDGQFVDLVYQNVLGRAPDAGGRSYWVRQLAAGATRGQVMLGFSESAEFIHQTGTLA